MPENRLELIAPDLVTRLQSAPEAALRAVAVATSKFALNRVSLTHPIINQVLHLYDSGRLPDSHICVQLEQLLHALDDAYFDLYDAVEDGRVEEQVYRAAFEKARAANALWFALAKNPFVAATEALYEANAATADLDPLRHIVNHILVQPQ